jgi:hypothetical protein
MYCQKRGHVTGVKEVHVIWGLGPCESLGGGACNMGFGAM